MAETLTEYITISRTEYERLRQAKHQYETEYERCGAEYECKAAEMRRVINQAHEQLAVAVREIQQLQSKRTELRKERTDE